MSEQPTVIVVSGPQCVGKTAVAEAVAREVRLPLFCVDPLMLVLASPELMASPEQEGHVPAAGIELQSVLLEGQLSIGLGAILECVASEAVRQRWRSIAAAFRARYVGIECVCSDRSMHKARFDARPAFRVGSWTLTWPAVEHTLATYKPDGHAAVVVDAVHPLGENIRAVLQAIS
jgi:predicted kinase